MAMRITEDCINCQVCEPECPNEAIFFEEGMDLYQVASAYCTECVGHFDDPQCIEVCPVDCIEIDPDNQESWTELQAKHERLQA